MIGSTSRLANLKAASNTVGMLMMLTGLTAAVVGCMPGQESQRVWLIAGGCLAVLVGLFVIVGSMLVVKIESNTFRTHSQLLDMLEIARRQSELLAKLAENSALSDSAKSLANRDQECESLRAAIRADLRMERWDTAMSLVDGMEEHFGFVEDAQALREEVNDARVNTMRQKLSQATELVREHLEAREWEKALHEINRLQRALPDEPRIAKLRGLYDSKRTSRKAELLGQWQNAVTRNDVDEAIQILQELDHHLTREEARSLEESARGVFKAKLLQLGMRFQFAVTEQRWRDALETGVQIMEEFPNSRMSREVAEAMDGLRRRTGLHGDVEITTSNQEKG